MEELLHYVWKHKILPIRDLTTTDGRTIEVINPGVHNHDAGPDFKEAKIKIDGIEWVGNVEIHVRTSDWFRHEHDKDSSYSNIILHVASIIDTPLLYPNGEQVPQLQLEVPEYIKSSYSILLTSDCTPRCANAVSDISQLRIHSWMSALTIERLEMRTNQIMQRRLALDKNWEDTLFVTIARSFGFGKNGDAFELWAHSIPMSAVGKHRDDLFQIEAIFFGQAGLLDDSTLPRTGVPLPDYYTKLKKEYTYLRQKFSLTPIEPKIWKFLRLRPQNFPHIRIAQLAMLYYSRQLNLSKLANADSIEKIHNLLQTHVSDFWKTHYSFSTDSSAKNDKQLSSSSLNLLVINSVAPILFAYGRYKGEDRICDFAMNLWDNTKPESNRIIRQWDAAGIKCKNASDTQALIQLTHNYCERHDCLRCRFGYEFIKKNPGFLREKN